MTDLKPKEIESEYDVVGLKPREIELKFDEYVVGQKAAKRKLSLAAYMRQLCTKLPKHIREEVVPKNILMIGPTGVGKTKLIKCLAKIVDAPTIKVDATKYTEVGYVGRDVESIIRDLADIAVKRERDIEMKKVEHLAADAAEERILDVLLPPAKGVEKTDGIARQSFRKQLREGTLDDTEIEIDVQSSPVGVEIMAPPGLEEMTNQLQSMFQQMGTNKTRIRKMSIGKAKRILHEEEAAKLINDEETKVKAIEKVERNGIVFIDEIDKVARRAESVSGADVSREGVQRDLLPLIEGTTVSTKYGMIKTDHILFIASGAFMVTKPSDLIAELQGRLPLRVELSPLTIEDFELILTEPKASLTEQYSALLALEGVELIFDQTGIRRIAEIAWTVNERTENIGARRLYTVIECVLETISYEASERAGDKVIVDEAYVNQYLGELVEDEDLARYIL